MIEKNISARPFTQKPYNEKFHVRQLLWTILMLIMYQLRLEILKNWNK